MNRQARWILLLLGLAVVVVLLPVNPVRLNRPSRDSSVFLYTGEQILNGSLPYRDVWDHKGPAIYYLDALGLLLANGSRWGVWLLELISLWCATVLGYLLTARAAGSRAAILASALFLMNVPLVVEGGNLTEEYALPFQYATLYLFWRSQRGPNSYRHLSLVGMTAAVCFLLRPNSIGVHIAIALYLCVSGIVARRVRSALISAVAMALGAAVVLAPVIGYFAWHGALAQLLNAVLRYNAVYSADATFVARLLSVFRGLRLLGLTGLPLLAFLGWLFAAMVMVLRILPGPDKQVRPLIGVLLVALPVELGMASLSGRTNAHYYLTWLPVFSILAGWGLLSIVRSIFPTRMRVGSLTLERSSIWLSGILLVWTATQPQYPQALVPPLLDAFRPQDPAAQSAVQSISRLTDQDEYLLVWGAETWVNLLAGKQAPTRFVYQYPLNTCGYDADGVAKEILTDVLARKPVIVDTSPTNRYALPLDTEKAMAWWTASGCRWKFPGEVQHLLQTIREHYRLDTIIEPQGWPVYRYQEQH